jgi:hypothetical protein
MTPVEVLLAQCHDQGITLTPHPDGRVHITAAGSIPEELLEELRLQKNELLAVLTAALSSAAQLTAAPEPPPEPAPAWDERTQELVTWFGEHQHELPREPFYLCAGVRIADIGLFYESMTRDIAAGPSGPRARSGALLDDLLLLNERWCLQHQDDALSDEEERWDDRQLAEEFAGAEQ